MSENRKPKAKGPEGIAAASQGQPIALALQGGGTFGAFAWGAIDQLLLDARFEIEAISATSGGAMSAAVMATGMLQGGREKARETLHDFWRKVSLAASMMPLRATAVDKLLSNVGLDFTASSLALDAVTRIFSPYQFNLFDINPLRAILEETADFDLIRRNNKIKLFINATHVRSGKPRVFTTEEITLEAVMASACLPFVFKTVEVGGEPYWDGSYSGNPALAPILKQCVTGDIVLVQITPTFVDEVPTKAADILDRATEISFNAALMQELRGIDAMNRLIEKGAVKGEYRRILLHRIEAQETLVSLGRASKLNADWDFLVHLHDLGVQAAQDWLEQHASAVGDHGSLDLPRMYG